MLTLTTSIRGKRISNIIGALKELVEHLESTGVPYNIVRNKDKDKEMLGILSGEPISYNMVGIQENGNRVLLVDGFHSRGHCFTSTANAVVGIEDNDGIALGLDGQEYKVIRLVVEDNEGNVIYHRGRSLQIKLEGK